MSCPTARARDGDFWDIRQDNPWTRNQCLHSSNVYIISANLDDKFRFCLQNFCQIVKYFSGEILMLVVRHDVTFVGQPWQLAMLYLPSIKLYIRQEVLADIKPIGIYIHIYTYVKDQGDLSNYPTKMMLHPSLTRSPSSSSWAASKRKEVKSISGSVTRGFLFGRGLILLIQMTKGQQFLNLWEKWCEKMPSCPK